MGSRQAQSIESITEEHFEPIIRYHEERKVIPGDPYGWKLPGCGNISHWEEARRYNEYPKFTDRDFRFLDGEKAEKVKQYLGEIRDRGINAVLDVGQTVRSTEEEVVVDHHVENFSVRVMQMCDVSVVDPKSYCNAARSRRLDNLSDQRVAEAPMGRDVENMLMAKRMNRGEAPKMPMHRDGTENKKTWYKAIRSESYNVFWVGTSREERDALREEARDNAQRDPALEPLVAQIEKEDKSQSKDYFYHYQRDRAAAVDDSIYEQPKHDIVIVLDKDSEVVLTKFSKLLVFLFQAKSVEKLEDAVRKWTALPPLPLPETSRHMVDEMIRLENPHMDLEKATTLKEVEKRVQCVVHYGTWTMKGRTNPDHVWKTPDSKLSTGLPRRRLLEDIPSQVFPVFTTKAVGLASEAVRFLFSTMAPDEYTKCLDVYRALPDDFKVPLSEPTFSTLFVLGVNSYTQRHSDKTDIKFGFASLVGLGSYTGGDLCFPQLALKLGYQPGDCVMFRGRELEHFVHDWDGYRIFLLFTNHQPVRNYAFRKLRRLPSKPNDPWHERGQASPDDDNAGEGKTVKVGKKKEDELDPDDDDYYSPCLKDIVTPEFEEVTEREWQGPAMLPSTSSSADT
ncbi:hypothetical protein PG985_013757 [Apiospora marii]|uniref:uncharacterized protein n=1 Tax=Apiospora marii TaxID=335849 RepID=UPI00312E059F